MSPPPPQELRVVISARDYEAVRHLFQEGLGLRAIAGWDDPDGRGVVLDAGRATLEIVDEPQARRIGEIEAGRADPPGVRLAFRVTDTPAAGERLRRAGARVAAPPVETPWGHHNQRLSTPGGLPLTLFHPHVELP
ncbi:VOC family protein [Deinococcus apachensis]|uniref:VOC family protein n=1 Tax=Deinococcus apachensis TaxID=309886 RepID=UPI0003709570|nr:VOC family protein [Deinococcus apachensis]